jgi:putative phosphoesterase
LPAAVLDAATRADVILHAGDVVTVEVLDELRRFAPIHAVLGNNDVPHLAGRLPETVSIELAGVAVAMVHDSGPSAGRARRLRRGFPDADVVVFGHSHIPVNDLGEGDQVLFNPGSPTQRRRQPERTFGVLELDDGRIIERTIVAIPAV